MMMVFVSDIKHLQYLIQAFLRRDAVEAVGSLLEGINCAAAPKIIPTETLNGCHHDP